jgi:hypothetical protein
MVVGYRIAAYCIIEVAGHSDRRVLAARTISGSISTSVRYSNTQYKAHGPLLY